MLNLYPRVFFRLILGCKQLVEHKTLHEYGIQKDCTLRLFLHWTPYPRGPGVGDSHLEEEKQCRAGALIRQRHAHLSEMTKRKGQPDTTSRDSATSRKRKLTRYVNAPIRPSLLQFPHNPTERAGTNRTQTQTLMQDQEPNSRMAKRRKYRDDRYDARRVVHEGNAFPCGCLQRLCSEHQSLLAPHLPLQSGPITLEHIIRLQQSIKEMEARLKRKRGELLALGKKRTSFYSVCKTSKINLNPLRNIELKEIPAEKNDNNKGKNIKRVRWSQQL